MLKKNVLEVVSYQMLIETCTPFCQDKRAPRPLPPPPDEVFCAPVMVKDRESLEMTPFESCPKDRVTPVPLVSYVLRGEFQSSPSVLMSSFYL